MQYIKKLVILTGNIARGTLMLEKTDFGVKCKLNTFDLDPRGKYKLAIFSGDDLFVMGIAGGDRCINFDPGDIGADEIHAAVISDKVIMYGSNCSKKLSHDVIMAKVARKTGTIKEDSFISFSGPSRSGDYFKRISPPKYDDFAIAESNYYPAYVNMANEVASTVKEDVVTEKTNAIPFSEKSDNAKLKASSVPPSHLKSEKKADVTYVENKLEEKKKIKEGSIVNNKIMPHELEQKYLRLMGMAANASAESSKDVREVIADKEIKTASTQDDKQEKGIRNNEQNITVCEKPEVIAMARRVTLRDYRVEEPKRPSRRRATFFERSSAQIEKLMNSCERFTAIERLIPGSKFVKINYDKKRFYIVGVIGRDYICYGVPSVYSDTPPELFDGYARWLPFDADKPRGEGFWMMYQDGVSGETLKS